MHACIPACATMSHKSEVSLKIKTYTQHSIYFSFPCNQIKHKNRGKKWCKLCQEKQFCNVQFALFSRLPQPGSPGVTNGLLLFPFFLPPKMGKYGEEKRRDTHANDHSEKRRDSFSSAAAAATLMQIRVDKKKGKDPSIICLFLYAALTDARLSVFLRRNSYSWSRLLFPL